MKVEKNKSGRIARLLLTVNCALLITAMSASADVTNSWHFTNYTYNLSNPLFIEVNTNTPGYAQLVLQAQNKYYTTVNDYTNASYRNLLDLGFDSYLRLSGSPGSYSQSGSFISRIFDGGGGGNIWQGIRAKVENVAFITDSRMVAYFALDDDNWVDAVSGLSATPSTNSMYFISDAMVGSHAAAFNGVTDYNLLQKNFGLASAVTISLWVKASDPDNGATPTLYACGLGAVSPIFSFRIGGSWAEAKSPSKCIGVYTGGGQYSFTVADTYTTATDGNLWRHIVVCYDSSASPTVRIYKDGVLLPMISEEVNTSLATVNKLSIGTRCDLYSRWNGMIDEFAVWSTALSAAEVTSLYNYRYKNLKPLKFQVRSGSAIGDFGTKLFVGSDGTTNSYFYNEGFTNSSTDFNPSERYLQYQAFFNANTNRTRTPLIGAVGLYGDQTVLFDNSSYDFNQGSYSSTTNEPASSPTPSLGLTKNLNGGYCLNGTYTSRALDAGSSIAWNTISWKVPAELSSSLSGLVGLWHMNLGWGSDKGGFLATPQGGVTFTNVAKFGSGGGLFNGSSARVDINIGGVTNQSVEFWLKNSNPNDGILEISTVDGTAYLSVSNHIVTLTGSFGVGGKVYVNGNSSCLKLLNGWNHVALVFGSPLGFNTINLGVANSDFMEGAMDELALYNYPLRLAEANAHFTAGRRFSGGSVQAQVRYGDSLPLTNSFAGPGGFTSAYYVNGNSLALPGNARYLQYRLFLAGDGDVTPNVDSVTLNYGAGSTIIDDTQPEFVQGTFDSAQTIWYGDDVKLLYPASIGPANLNLSADPFGMNMWHLDEPTWLGGGSIVIDSRGGMNANPYGNANTVPSAAVGSYCGSFGGVGDYLDLTTINLPGDFSINLWFNTSDSSNRMALLSSDNGGGTYFTIEMNGDGSAFSAGKAAITIFDGGTPFTVVANRQALNDGQWHNLAAVRGGAQVHLYIDGEREGTANIGTGYGALGSKTVYAGARPMFVPDLFYNGVLDEVAIWSRPLTEAEIGNNYAGGYRTQGTGEYISEVVDANDQAIWQTLYWATDGTYSKPLSVGDADLVGMWHMEESASPITNSVAVNNGVFGGGVIAGVSGRSGNCLDFNGTFGVVTIAGPAVSLEPPNLTVEAWINPDNAIDGPIVDKSSGPADGYVIGLDSSGFPYFRVAGTTCNGNLPVRVGKWTHIAGTYDSVESRLRLYVDGEMAGITAPVAVSTVSGRAVSIGRDGVAAFYFDGRIDEVAIHKRTLNGEEILDHYRAGAVTLKIQARSSTTDPAFTGINFVGPDKTTNTFFVESLGSSLASSMDLGQYFQYKVYFASENYRLTPKLSGVRVYVANYPTANPTVEPDTSRAIYFPGRLRGFTEVAIPGGASANVRYQISGDGGATPSWYWWNGAAWASNALSDYNFANPVSVINANITNFFELFYPKSGGNFRFRAFLHSQGDYQIQLDRVNFVASAGRIVVTVPNGEEIGSKAWVVGTPQTIRWTTDGVVSGNLVIELWNQSGSNFVATLGSGLPNTSNYTVKISDNLGSQYRIKIRDANDATIYDVSDSDFWLIQDFHLTSPDGGELWYAGQTNTVRWDSPGPAGVFDLGTPASLWFSGDDGTNWVQVGTPPNAVGNNTYVWNVPSNDARLVSEQARMGIALDGVSDPITSLFGDISDSNFVMAGIAVTYPTAGIGIKMGGPVTVSWAAAGAGAMGVRIDLYNGVAWTNLTMNAPCVPGSNSFDTVFLAPNPTEGAKVRITANQFPAVWGMSSDFTLADINIISPKGGTPAVRDHWQIGTTNTILWTSGGAGNFVDIEYSPDGSNWVTIAAGYTNINSGGTVITNSAPPWIVPGPPSSNSYIRIRSVSQPSLFAVTEPFDMAGVQVVTPNGGEFWEFASTNMVKWLFQGAGANIDMKIAYIDNPTTNDYEMVDPGITILSGQRLVAANKVRRPTNFGRVRIISTTMPMFDVSDNVFTIRGLSMTFPQSNAVYTMGMNVVTGLQWFSAATEDTSAEIYYSTDGSNFTDLVLTPLNIDGGAGDNKQDWLVPRNVIPSETAKLQVVAGPYTTLSPQFVLRGIRITQPAANAMYDIGTNKFVTWRAAGLQFSAKVAGSLSVSGLAGPYSVAGLNTNVPSMNGSMAWTIDPDLVQPTTNAIVRLSVWTPTNDTDVVMYSDPFTLRGLKFVAPSNGTVWALGSSVNVSFLSAGMGGGAMAAVYYSPDGGTTFDMLKPVTNNMVIADGLNTFAWNIENTSLLTRMPSTNAVLKIVSGSWSTISKPFRLSGIKVTSPSGSDIWAVSDGTNTIKWVSVDTINSYNISFTVWAGAFPLTTQQIVAGAGGNSYDWTMTAAAIGSNVTITITDGTATGQSEKFEVVAAPSVRIINPAAGDFWKVSESNEIQWIQGGRMSNSFVLLYSSYPFVITNLLKVGAFPVTNNIFSHTWDPIPNALGQTRIIVTNVPNSSIADQFENFSIAAKFEITPFSGDMYALSPVGVNWVTRGDVSSVDLYYSTDPLRSASSWQKVNTEGPYSANVGHNLPATPYPWTVANYKTNTMWLRIQDHTYSNQAFDVSKPGPYDDTGPFEVKYYRITWRVFDVSNTQQLDNISMQDNLGWSASDMLSPIVHEYPFGTWTAVFYREFFHDTPILNWEAKPSRTNDVYMTRSEIEPEPHVLANFAYDITGRKFTIHSWLERNGQIMKTPTLCTIGIYSSSGVLLETMTATVPDQNGVFWTEWNVSATETRLGVVFASTDVFFAKVEVKYSGATYSAGLTLQLRLAAGEDTVAAMDSIVRQATSNILAGVNVVGSNVVAFRGDTGTTLSNLTAIAQATRTDIMGMATNIAAMTNALIPAITSLTNEMIGVLEPAITNLNAQVTNMAPDLVSDLARILERSTTVAYGSTNRILYKTRKGYDSTVVQISVSSPAQGVTYSGNMSEVVPGIYENELIANWGVDNYTVTCSDPLARDSIVLTVTASGSLEDVPPMISAMTNRLSGIEDKITNIVALVSGLKATDLSGVMTSIDEVKSAVQNIQGVDLSSVESKLETLASQIGSMSDASSANSFFGQIARVNEQLNTIGYSSSEAFKKARAAQTEAGSAASAISTLKTLIEQQGKTDNVQATLDDVRRSMEAARENMKSMSSLLRVGELYDALNDMASQMKKLADSKQYKLWTEPIVEKPAEAAPGVQVPESPEESIKKLSKGVDEIKGTVLLMQKLIEAKSFEPMVTEELQGVVE